MRFINLLPPEMARSKCDRQRVRARRYVVIAVAAFAAVWGGAAWMQFDAMRARRAEAERQLQTLLARKHQFEADLKLCQDLQERIDAANQLRNAVTPSAALALVVQLTPDSIEFSELSMNWPSLKAPSKSDPRSAPRAVSVTIMGTTDALGQIPVFIGRLSKDPHIARVRTQHRAARVSADGMHEVAVALDVLAPPIAEASGL